MAYFCVSDDLENGLLCVSEDLEDGLFCVCDDLEDGLFCVSDDLEDGIFTEENTDGSWCCSLEKYKIDVFGLFF